MTDVGRALLTGFVLCACCSGVSAQVSDEASEAFDQRHWNKVVELIDEPVTAEAVHMLAIACFELLDFKTAAPLLDKALQSTPENVTLVSARLEIHLAMQEFEETIDKARQLKGLDEHLAAFALARVELAKPVGDREAAKEELDELLEQADQDLALKAANALIEAHLTDGELGPAYAVAQRAIGRHPDPENAIRYAPFIPEQHVGSELGFDLGYRLEYDDNVTFPDEAFGSGKDDFRHVFMADAHYQKPLRDGWGFYALGNVLQSIHNDLDEFNQTRLAASATLAQTGERTGWRIPVEVSHVRLDGDSFHTSIATVPGFQVQFGKDYFLHFYGRLQDDDYEIFATPEENRSGTRTGGGIMFTGQLTSRLYLRSYIEFNQHDADGQYWQRDENVVFLHGEFAFSFDWSAGLALRYQEDDYDNARPEFGDRQEDESKELYLNLTRRLEGNWRVRGQVSVVNRESNIPIFNYDRNVYSVAIVREF